MRPKSNPQVDRLREEAREAHERLLSVVGKLQKKFGLDEQVGQDEPPEPKYANGKH